MNFGQIGSLILKRFPNIKGVYLYGSFATGTNLPTSDIDFAVLADEPISKSRLFEVSQEIASMAKRDAELVDLRSAPTVFQFQVVGSGNLIQAVDKKECEKFEDFVYKSYARLNEERSGILSDIQKRGRVF